MADEKSETEKKVINIEDFLSIDNEEKGKWFEPIINGVPCGIQFLVTGRNTDENTVNSERHDKALAEANNIKDNFERTKKKKELDANRVAEFVKGIRTAPDSELHFGGKPIEYSVPFVQMLLLKSPLIKEEIVRFAIDPVNFIGREKNA